MQLESGSEYLRDESRLSGSGEQLVFVKKCTELQHYLDLGEKVTVQGSRTGIAGACVPRVGTVLNFSQMGGILGKGNDGQGVYMDVLPGTTLEEIRLEAGSKYFFPPDPTEKTASIGGMLATNAAGPSAYHYGTTAEYVSEADVLFPALGWMCVKRGNLVFSPQGEMMFPDGVNLKISYLNPDEKRVIRQLLPEKNMDLLDLLAGSEGMLGIFGRIRIRLCPRPGEKWSLLCFFRDEKDALAFSGQIINVSQKWKSVSLTADDFMDKNSLRYYQNSDSGLSRYARIPEIPADHCAVMISIVGNVRDNVEKGLEEILVLLEEYGCSDEATWAADTEQEQEQIRVFRHAIPECINEQIGQIRCKHPGFSKLSLDVTCPEVPADVFLTVLRECADVKYAVTLHAGRKLFHVDFLPETEEQIKIAKQNWEEILAYVVNHHGILSAENGVGKGKGRVLKKYVPENQRCLMSQIKSFFDPYGQLNAGNIWD